jgi:hypothetical protein
MNKKILSILGVVVVTLLSWLFAYKPVPPFGGTTPIVQSTPTYFAEVDSNGNVLRVIVATQKVIDSGIVGDSKNWIQTSMDGSLRKNYAGTGYTYDKTLDAFIAPQPASNFILDTQTANWKGTYPTPIPTPFVKTASI